MNTPNEPAVRNWQSDEHLRYVLELDQVSLEFEEGRPVLRDCSLRVKRGETKVILGASGAGKSTILRLALGLLKPDQGRVVLFGKDITEWPENDLRSLRRRTGIVFQGGALFDSMTVAENVGFPLIEGTESTMEDAEAMVRKRLEYVGLADAYDLRPSEISGGMAKRVAIARAMVTRPELMLYDEATSGLDPISSRRMNLLLNSLRDDYGVSSVLVTHILEDARAVADSMALLHRGEIIFDGTPDELFSSADTRVQEFTQAEFAK